MRPGCPATLNTTACPAAELLITAGWRQLHRHHQQSPGQGDLERRLIHLWGSHLQHLHLLAGGSGVHYDQGLSGGGKFKITSWREL